MISLGEGEERLAAQQPWTSEFPPPVLPFSGALGVPKWVALAFHHPADHHGKDGMSPCRKQLAEPPDPHQPHWHLLCPAGECSGPSDTPWKALQSKWSARMATNTTPWC